MMRYMLIAGWILFLALGQALAQDGYESIRSGEVRVIDGKSFYLHQVKKGQTLYAISKAYHVEMQVIIDGNPEIKNGLKANQTLYIPVLPGDLPAQVSSAAEQAIPEPPVVTPAAIEREESSPAGTSFVASQKPCGSRSGSLKEVYNVALMMHLFLHEADSMKTEYPSQEEIDSYNPLRYIQFYEGFLLAVDSLQKTGLNLNVWVYDVDTDPSAMNTVLRKPEMEGMDLIVGMLFNRNFQVVANWARDHQIPLVSPVSERESQVEGNPMVIKVRPAPESEGTALAEYLLLHHPYNHVMIVRSWEADVRKMADNIFSNCKALGMEVSVIEEEEVIGRMNRGIENLILVLSNQKPFVLNVLSKLNADTTGYRFTVFGLPRWDQFEGMDYQYLERTRTHVVVPSWIDYQDPAVTRFVTRFRERFKTEPDPLAFQGYDVGWYFLNVLSRYGTGFIGCLNEVTVKPLQTVYKFRQQPGDGWENHHWEMFLYEDFSRVSLN